MTVARRGLGLCLLPGGGDTSESERSRDRLFAAGGQDDEPTKTVEYFNDVDEAWVAVAPMGDKRLNFGEKLSETQYEKENGY